MSRYKSRASKHADRSWSCPCGRTVWGNGGKSSHQRACRIYKEHRLERIESLLSEPATSDDSFYKTQFRRQQELERDRLRAELAEATS